jgi:hypothetical protein
MWILRPGESTTARFTLQQGEVPLLMPVAPGAHERPHTRDHCPAGMYMSAPDAMGLSLPSEPTL